MNYIQKAIEKAREQRDGRVGTTTAVHLNGNATEHADSVERLQLEIADNEPAKRTSLKIENARNVDTVNEVLHENRVIAGFDLDRRVEVYRQLRAKVLRSMELNGWKSLAITSPGENAGKTLTAINLAISISRDVNHQVILVDLDLRSPSVHESLGVATKFGVVDCLEGKSSLSEALFTTNFERLLILPGTPQKTYVSELLTSPEMVALKEELESHGDSCVVIYDLPPLLRNDDALVFTPKVDTNLLIVEDGITTADDLRRSLHMLEGSNLMGTILNKAR